jgi:hypothetical protein
VEESDASHSADASTASSRTATGHEAATLAERFILAFRLPYAIGCMVVGLGLFGILDVVFYHYAMTASLSEGLQKRSIRLRY